MSLRRKCSNCAHAGGWVRWQGSKRRHPFCQIAQAATYKALAIGKAPPRIDQFSCSFWELKP